jgi:hypothetical protein
MSRMLVSEDSAAVTAFSASARWFAQAVMITAASIASTQNDSFFIFEFLLRWLR